MGNPVEEGDLVIEVKEEGQEPTLLVLDGNEVPVNPDDLARFFNQLNSDRTLGWKVLQAPGFAGSGVADGLLPAGPSILPNSALSVEQFGAALDPYLDPAKREVQDFFLREELLYENRQAAEFAAAQAAANSAERTRLSDLYDETVFNLKQNYDRERLARDKAYGAFKQQAAQAQFASDREKIAIQMAGLQRKSSEAAAQYSLQLETLANQREDFNAANTTSADPYRAVRASQVGENSPLATYAKQVIDRNIASDKEKLDIGDNLAAEQERARQAGIRDQQQLLAQQEADNWRRSNEANLIWINGWGEDAVYAVQQGMSLREAQNTFQKRIDGVGTSITVSDDLGLGGSTVDNAVSTAVAGLGGPYMNAPTSGFSSSFTGVQPTPTPSPAVPPATDSADSSEPLPAQWGGIDYNQFFNE